MMGSRKMMLQAELGLLLVLFASISLSAEETQVYLVSLSPSRPGKADPANTHGGYLEAALGSAEKVESCLIYCYENVLDGFAAMLTAEEVTSLSKMPGVLRVTPNRKFQPTTTNSWKFLGVESSSSSNTGALWERAHYGKDVILGIIDTGITPESASFNDAGLGPIPARWKGECVEGEKFPKTLCNRKLIGAKYFSRGNVFVDFGSEYNSTRDFEGHGTHVAATAGGSFAVADINGYANGTAKGGAPQARLAMYKVCWQGAGCTAVDILAAIEEAIKDGVDLISASISGSNDQPFWDEVMPIASFHAMRKGILVTFAGGNDGPSLRTVSHVEPWSFTVAATTQDRFLGAYVQIKLSGSPRARPLRFRGATLTKYSTISAPLVLATQAASTDRIYAMFCYDDSLVPSLVEGKIVLCMRGHIYESIESKSQVVRDAGGIGMIVANTKELGDYTLDPAEHLIPAVHITADDGQQILDYLSKCDLDSCILRKTTATIYAGKTFTGVRPAPVIAEFSSCGPSGVTGDILKPDISAPGVNILAAWTGDPKPFATISGTSMATPHISGVLALIKAVHPRWSPAAMKSAIMTSAQVLDNTGRLTKNPLSKPAGPFSTGSGLVNPNVAVDPGLVYEAGPRDYTLFLCALGYDDVNVELITGEQNACTSHKYFPTPSNLNYPSVSVSNLQQTMTITRRVTNVGPAKSVYTASIQAPKGLRVTIYPSRLSFSSMYETRSFTITLKRTLQVDASQEAYVFGSYTWSDGVHKVRSPIVVGHQAPQ